MNKTLYAILQQIAIIWLPAAGTLLFALQPIWNWNIPMTSILGTITAVDTFLGTVLHLAPTPLAAADGTLVVHDTPAKTTYSLNVATPLDQIPGKDTITLKVRPPDSAAGTFNLVAPGQEGPDTV